jgi:hypothetical protein
MWIDDRAECQHLNTENIVYIAATKRNTDPFMDFQNILKNLLMEYRVPLETLDLNKITHLLYNQKTEALIQIRELLRENDYISFYNKFLGHSQIIDIWIGEKRSVELEGEGNLFDKFKNDLKSLWIKYKMDDELDFNRLAQQLFDEDMKALEEIKDYMLDDDFTRFKLEMMEDERFKEIWKAKKPSTFESVDNTFAEFKTEMIKLLQSENLQPDKVEMELLLQELYENKDKNIAKFFKNILIPKKIKQLIIKIQLNTKLKTMWISNMLIFATMKNILEKYITFTNDGDEVYKIISELYVDPEHGMKLIEGKCTSENFNKIKSNLYENVEIRSKVFQLINVITPRNIDDIQEHSPSHPDLQNIRRLQKVMFGKTHEYSDQLFTEISPLNYDSLKEILKVQENKSSDESLLDVMLPYILSKLKTGIDLSEICELEIFWDEASQLYGMDYKTLFVCMIERYQRHQLNITSLIKNLGVALPFAYQWMDAEKFIMKIPLRAYSHCLVIDCPIVVSLGSNSIGKSTLLNKIYSAGFVTNKAGIINDGIDVLFSTPEFACGFTIFDIHGHACEKQDLLKVFFKMMPLENCWILLQSRSLDDTETIIKTLKAFGVNNGQIICIIRDCKDGINQNIEQLADNRKDQVLSIRKIEENNTAFNSNLAVLREKLFKLTGIGHSSRKPNGANLKKHNHNVYLDIEDRISNERYANIRIDTQDESIRRLSISIDTHLTSIDGNIENLQEHLFQHVTCNKTKQNEKNKKAKLAGKETGEKQAELTKIDQTILNLSQNKANTVPSELVCQYNKLFIHKEFHLINELDKRVTVWQSPILSPLFQERNEIVSKIEACTTAIADIQAKNNNSQELERQQTLIRELQQRKKRISKLIDDKTINRDIFMRELLAIYGDNDFLSNMDSRHEYRKLNFNKDLYISSFIDYMIKGNEIEIIDGDNNSFNYEIVSKIFRGLEAIFKKSDDGPPFVVSVIGPQSTGKSTLLNMLFGSNFQTSAGRCTKGLYASIFETQYRKAKTLLVLDTEGLLSIEKANEEYDKKLTLFSMACSQIMLINLNGEINTAMKKILSISIFVANQLKVFKTRPIIMFVLRNMMDLNVNKQREMIDNIKKELKEVSELSKLKLNQVLDFKEEKAFFLMFTAFNKDFVYNKSEELFQKSTTNIKFAKLSQELRERVFAEADTSVPKFTSLSDWAKQASNIWKTIDMYNDMIMIESIKEISDRKELSDIITKIMEIYIEPNEAKTSFRSILETILTKQESLMDGSPYVFSDVEQQFNNESESFREKVKQKFEDQVKSKSYTVKLMNEYKDRLLSAITSSKTQALQKYKALAEKRKIKNKTQAALTELQNRSEIKILEWQKVQQGTSDEKMKAKTKNNIINEFKKFMDDTKIETAKEMEKSKKTRDQWADFVMQQIKSAVGTLPVEKIFFSLSQLDQKSAGPNSSINIIRLINNQQETIDQNTLLEKVPLLIQRKQKYWLTNQNSAKKEDTAYSTGNQIYSDKSSNYLTEKWRQATSWISHLFQRETHNTGKRKNRDSSSHSYSATTENQNYNSVLYSQSPSIGKIYEAGISPEATVLIYSMFLETNEYLQSSIKDEIIRSAEYQITGLKQNILQIEAKINELNQKFLEEEGLEFTHTFGNELIGWLYEIIVDKMFTDEENTYRKMKDDFEKDVDGLLQDLTERLDAAFGDSENAQDMAKKMFNNFKNIFSSKIELEYKHDLEQATYLNADKLVELSDKVFYEENGRFNQDGIYAYITNMIDYMKKIYFEYFKDKATNIEKRYNEKYITMYSDHCKNLINKLQRLEEIFKNYYWIASHSGSHKTNFTKFFKAYLEGNIDNQLIDTYLKQTLNLIYYHSDIELLESSKLFQNISISIYSITNPKVFLQSFISKIQSLCENDKTNDIKFKLTDDILKEKDKIKVENQQKALGCIEQCPYCGCKCTEVTEHHDAHHSDKHRLMAFNGSFEQLKKGKKGFVFDLCNSDNTIRHSRWKENSSSQLSIRDSKLIRERMNEYSVGEGDVTITLAWFDSNDLDLHVTCPCGTDLYFGNKKCSTCEGYLDLDMNVCYHVGSCPDRKCHSTKPTESVYFRPAKKGLYKVSVKYFRGPKGNAGKSSEFEIRIQTHANNNVQTFTGCVEADTEKRHVRVGEYEHSDVSLNFLEHVKKNFPSWSNIRPINDDKWEIVLKKAWWQVAPKMSQFYGYENNTPTEFKKLKYQ